MSAFLKSLISYLTSKINRLEPHNTLRQNYVLNYPQKHFQLRIQFKIEI